MTNSSSSSLTVASLFCGAGGLDLGFQYAGFKTIWANDIIQGAAQTYKHNFGLEPVCADINEFPIADIPSVDVIIGGPPCQSFSLLGMRAKNDPRGKLVFRFLQIIKKKKPRAFVMENVPGLAASKINGRRVTDVLAAEFELLGYTVNVIKLSADDYLVPQQRKRIFILGNREGFVDAPNPDLYAKECYGFERKSFDVSAKAAIDDLGECVDKCNLSKYRCSPHSDFARLMRVSRLSAVSLHEQPRMSNTDKAIIKYIPPGGNYMDIPDRIAPGRVMKFKKTGGRTTTYGRLHPDRPAYTINTYFRRPNVGCNFHYREMRLITAREAMRFQSFPDDFDLKYGSQDERNLLIGNAVPPLLAHAIAWTIKKSLRGAGMFVGMKKKKSTMNYSENAMRIERAKKPHIVSFEKHRAKSVKTKAPRRL